MLWPVVRELRNRLPNLVPTGVDNIESDPSVSLLEIFACMTKLLISRVKRNDRAIPHAARLAAGALALISNNDQVAQCSIVKRVRFFPKPHEDGPKSELSMLHFAVGIVLSIDDPGRNGRALINCPSIDPEAVWARIVRPFISATNLPKTGDQVLVAFEVGDAASAYVLGSLWSDRSTDTASTAPA